MDNLKDEWFDPLSKRERGKKIRPMLQLQMKRFFSTFYFCDILFFCTLRIAIKSTNKSIIFVLLRHREPRRYKISIGR